MSHPSRRRSRPKNAKTCQIAAEGVQFRHRILRRFALEGVEEVFRTRKEAQRYAEDNELTEENKLTGELEILSPFPVTVAGEDSGRVYAQCLATGQRVRLTH